MPQHQMMPPSNRPGLYWLPTQRQALIGCVMFALAAIVAALIGSVWLGLLHAVTTLALLIVLIAACWISLDSRRIIRQNIAVIEAAEQRIERLIEQRTA